MSKLTSYINFDIINKKSYRDDYIFRNKDRIQYGDIYQFGVYSGMSMVSILDGFKRSDKEYGTFFGLDSFCGIPKETNEPLPMPEWGEGEFSTLDYLSIDDTNLASQEIEKYIKSIHPEARIEMVVGYYSDSLAKINVEKLSPASYIDIDVDIYTSAKEVLRFLCENKVIVPGTVINYDDWIGTHAGEGRAHEEMCKDYGLQFEILINSSQRLFVCK